MAAVPLTPLAIIAKKRDQGELNAAEIETMIDGFVGGTIPDYQMSAWAMAVLCRGMSADETAALTRAMLDSGQQLQRATDRPRIDKHSTGGLGDKTSLILAPLLACFDFDVPMLSGRGLGITGGTLDKLEAYPGYNSQLSQPQIADQLRRVGCVISGATDELAPADRRLYSLRDVTGTVPSIPLITSSILSKKLTERLDALIVDVKFGSAAFMRDLPRARELAESLRATGQRLGLTTRTLLSDMNQPLGRMVGNACEANEAVAVLESGGPSDVRHLSVRLAAELLLSQRRYASLDTAHQAVQSMLDSGQPRQRLEAMVTSQGGQFSQRLLTAPAYEVCAAGNGWVQAIDGQQLGMTVIHLGGGRSRLGDTIDPSVGLEMLVRVGDAVEPRQPLVRIFARSAQAAEAVTPALLAAICIGSQPVAPLPLLADN